MDNTGIARSGKAYNFPIIPADGFVYCYYAPVHQMLCSRFLFLAITPATLDILAKNLPDTFIIGYIFTSAQINKHRSRSNCS
jgi:hypothetical protein